MKYKQSKIKPRPALGPNQVSFPEVKRPGRGVNHPPTIQRQVIESVGLYRGSPSGSSWPVPRVGELYH
jgi:hypothetical protein